MLNCTIPFNVLRHLQDTCSSWSQWEISDSQMDEAGMVLSPLYLDFSQRTPHPTSPFQSRMLRTISSQVLSISTSEDSTASLGILCQSLTTSPQEKSDFRWNSMWFNLCRLSPALLVSGFLFLTTLCLPSQQVLMKIT